MQVGRHKAIVDETDTLVKTKRRKLMPKTSETDAILQDIASSTADVVSGVNSPCMELFGYEVSRLIWNSFGSDSPGDSITLELYFW